MPGTRLRLCSPEDLIVFKAFAARPLDWHDVKMIIVRQGEANLDWTRIAKHLKPFCELKGQPEILQQLKELRTALREKGNRHRTKRSRK